MSKHHEVIHDLTLASELKIGISSCRHGLPGIQVRKDACGNIHVSLDSSIPCWNDGIERGLLQLTEAILNLFFWLRLPRSLLRGE